MGREEGCEVDEVTLGDNLQEPFVAGDDLPAPEGETSKGMWKVHM